MANGYPIAALCGKREIMDRFNTCAGGDVFFAGTYNGHPVGCAAALATIEAMETLKVHEHVFNLGERMRQGLAEIIRHLKIKATVAGFGSVFLIYFMEGPIESYADLLRNDHNLQIAYRKGLIQRGIFELPLSLKRSHISFSHTEELIQKTLQAAEDSLRGILAPAGASA
jgi:glutamate-1-semialdehyde 2,1-aminomutase